MSFNSGSKYGIITVNLHDLYAFIGERHEDINFIEFFSFPTIEQKMMQYVYIGGHDFRNDITYRIYDYTISFEEFGSMCKACNIDSIYFFGFDGHKTKTRIRCISERIENQILDNFDEPENKEIVYFFLAKDLNIIKIGKTKNDPIKTRLHYARKQVPCSVEYIAYCEGYTDKENELHKLFGSLRLKKENNTQWEWFKYTDEIKNYITQYCKSSLNQITGNIHEQGEMK